MTNPERNNEVPLRERPIEEIAESLQKTLGQRLVAYGIREKDPTKIGSFARAEIIPEEDAEKTLRDLAEVTETLSEKGSPEMVRAVMIGANPLLEGQAPIELIHQGEPEPVIAAASRF